MLLCSCSAIITLDVRHNCDYSVKGQLPMIKDIQKANTWKRISAYIFDSILLVIIAVGVAFLLSTLFRYDENTAKREDLREEYEDQYDISFDITQEDFTKLSEEEQKYYNDAYAAFATDPEVNRIDVLIINLSLLITVFSILAAFILLEFLIPLKLGHGRTLGKKIFGICVMRADCVKISNFQLFVRSILGKYTLETMIPVFLVLLLLFNVMPFACLVGIALILILQLAFLLRSQLRTAIHDMISGTVVVDFASQMIFDTPEELLAYKKKLHEEAAERAEY